MVWLLLGLVGCGCPPVSEAALQDPNDLADADAESALSSILGQFAAWSGEDAVCVEAVRLEDPAPVFYEGDWEIPSVTYEEARRQVWIRPSEASAYAVARGLCLAWAADHKDTLASVDSESFEAAYGGVRDAAPWATQTSEEWRALAFSVACAQYQPSAALDLVEETCGGVAPFQSLLAEEVFPLAPKAEALPRRALAWEPVVETDAIHAGWRRGLDGGVEVLLAEREGLGGYTLLSLETGAATPLPPLPPDPLHPSRYPSIAYWINAHYSEGVYLYRLQGDPQTGQSPWLWVWRSGAWQGAPAPSFKEGSLALPYVWRERVYAVQPTAPAVLRSYDPSTGLYAAETLPFDGPIERMTTRGDALYLLPSSARDGWYRTDDGWAEQALPDGLEQPLLSGDGRIAGLYDASPYGSALYFGSEEGGWFVEDACPTQDYIYRPVEGAIYRYSVQEGRTVIEQAALP